MLHLHDRKTFTVSLLLMMIKTCRVQIYMSMQQHVHSSFQHEKKIIGVLHLLVCLVHTLVNQGFSLLVSRAFLGIRGDCEGVRFWGDRRGSSGGAAPNRAMRFSKGGSSVSPSSCM